MFGEFFGPRAVRSAHFSKASSQPLIRADSGAWSRDFIAACSIVEHEGELRLYAEGSADDHEQIGLFTRPIEDIEGEWSPHPANPVLRVGDENADAYSQGGVFDPSVVYFRGRWLMYFSATEGDAHEYAEQLAHGTAGDGPSGESIGLAISDDGIAFSKHPDGPVMRGRCPFAFVHQDVIYLFHVIVHDGGYRVHLSSSSDGVRFSAVSENPVLDVGAEGSWDSRSVTTPKVFADGDRFWMAYAGDESGFDDLKGLGLAWSTGLLTWTKIDANPILGIGDDGDFDSVSVQSPIIIPANDSFALFYAGSDRTVGEHLRSQIGLAWLTTR